MQEQKQENRIPSSTNKLSAFPYEPREYQLEIMKDILEVLEDETDIVMESGTGTGKTISALSPSVEYALTNNKRIVYLTRTNSQQAQVILELREIIGKIRNDGVELSEDLIPGIGLQGRRSMCCMTDLDSEFENCTSEELSRLCNRLKRATRNKGIGMNSGTLKESMGKGKEKEKTKICPFFAKTLSTETQEIASEIRKDIPTAEEFIRNMTQKGLCPYEINKELVERSLIITAPYIYMFDKGLRHHFLDWIGASVEDIIVIVDEAHNLPDYARELVSAELSYESINRAASEAREYGAKGVLKILGGMEIPKFADRLRKIIDMLCREYVIDEDGLVPPYELEEEIMHSMKLTSIKLKKGIGELVNHGLAIQDEKLKNGKMPRSYIHSMGHFLMWWLEMESSRYIKLIRAVDSGENPTLEMYCMDPSDVIDVVRKCHASVHLSGTLRPLEEYRTSSGLPVNTLMRIYPSPFPRENRKTFYLHEVTTRYENLSPNMVRKLLDITVEVSNSLKRNIMIFFPSYKLVDKFLSTGFSFSLKRTLYIEEQGLKQNEIMDKVENFRGSGGVFLSVIGGRLSEGMDFPEDLLEIVMVVGIPYPKPTARQRALQHYYEIRFGKGWDYTVKAPTTRKLLQAIGRLIRTKKDKGAAVILDKRAVHFRNDVQDLTESSNLVEDIKAFFSE